MFDPRPMHRVTLTPYEVRQAASVGLERQLKALAANRPDAHGNKGDDGWTCHIEGACGELAVAKLLGLYWGGTVDTFHSVPDVGRIEVRTRSRATYELIIRQSDPPGRYVLVTGRAPHYTVRGWIDAADARRVEWWQIHGGRPGAWFVPHHALHPLPEGRVTTRGGGTVPTQLAS